MNKYLLLSAASLIASTVRADAASLPPPDAAGHISFYATTSGGTPFCNEWTVWRTGDFFTNRDSLSACAGYTGVTGVGLGLKVRTKSGQRFADLPDDLGTQMTGEHRVSDFVVSLPLRDGGYFHYYYWTAPDTINVATGYYHLGHPDRSKGLRPPIQMAIAGYARKHRAPDNK